jgi:transcriptional regulator with XRE-family HTH domain
VLDINSAANVFYDLPSEVAMYKPEVIQGAMDAKGITSEQLAERASITRMTVWNVLNSKHTPELKTLVAIAKALEIPLSSIIEEEAAA